MKWVIQPIHRWLGTYTPEGRKICSCELTGTKWRNCNAEKPGKHPWAGWKQVPMETPEQGYAAWRSVYDQYPHGVNIGVRTGPQSGIFAVDLDVGVMKNGIANFETWMASKGLGWEGLGTLSATTGGGGCHLVYPYPPEVQQIPSVASPKTLGPFIDVRGDGGFILVAPSVHHSGQIYQWRDQISPDAPKQAHALLIRAVEKQKRTLNALDLGAYTPSLEELKDYADELGRKKSPRSREIGKNMLEALAGKAIGEEGSRHNVYRDVVFMICKKWPRCNTAEILSHLEDSLREWYPDETSFLEAQADAATVANGVEGSNDEKWIQNVALNENGAPIPTDANMVLFFENHPAWQGVFGYNERRNRPEYLKTPPLENKPKLFSPTNDRSWITLWFQSKAQMVGRISGNDLQSAILASASKNGFDPLQAEVLKLRGTWDGVPRLDTVFQRVAGAPDSTWVRLVSPLWFKSVVARILWPGCKCDTMLILEGPQGFKKSSFFSALLPDPLCFSDSLNRVKHDMESIRLIHSGPAIFEIGELSGLRKQEVEEIKAFLSSQQDDLRPLYEAHRTTPRRCVFVGTTNRDDYLRDETGGRRFWPIKVLRIINIHTVHQERAQWFAEALYHVENGERWWLDDEAENGLAAVEQEERYEEDIWHSTVRDYLADRAQELPNATTGTEQMAEVLNKTKAGDFVTAMQVAVHALKLEIKNARTAEGIRINKIMLKLGWKRARALTIDRTRGWERP
jgi:predicted P-loop ATPase